MRKLKIINANALIDNYRLFKLKIYFGFMLRLKFIPLVLKVSFLYSFEGEL